MVQWYSRRSPGSSLSQSPTLSQSVNPLGIFEARNERTLKLAEPSYRSCQRMGGRNGRDGTLAPEKGEKVRKGDYSMGPLVMYVFPRPLYIIATMIMLALKECAAFAGQEYNRTSNIRMTNDV